MIEIGVPSIVRTDWLADRTGSGDLKLIDVRQPFVYSQAHVPSAVSLPTFLLTPPGGRAPIVDRIAQMLGRNGITAEDHIVAYDEGASAAAARLYWLLKYSGHPAVSVLDGGIMKWSQEGLPLESGAVSPSPAEYRRQAGETGVLATLEDVQAAVGGEQTQLLDVRSSLEFNGAQPTALRNGHIPGAKHLDWVDTFVQDDVGVHLRPDSELRNLLVQAGIRDDRPIIVHCQSGNRSSHMFLVLQHLGYPQVANYGAGWQEWGNRTDTDIEL